MVFLSVLSVKDSGSKDFGPEAKRLRVRNRDSHSYPQSRQGTQNKKRNEATNPVDCVMRESRGRKTHFTRKKDKKTPGP